MRKHIVLASTAGAILAAVGLTASTAQADHGSRHHALRVTVIEHAVSDNVVDLHPAGDSAGDLLTFANPVFDRTNAHRVGRDQGSCIRTRPGKAWQCSWTTWIGRSSLVVEGPFYDTRDSVLAITGGTGRFSTAQGVMRLHARNTAGTAYRFSFIVRR